MNLLSVTDFATVSGMENESIDKLTEFVQNLCIENEVLRIMVKHNWHRPPQLVPWETALGRNVADPKTRAPIAANFQNISSPTAAHVLGSSPSIFQSLLQAIEKTRQETVGRVDKA